MNSKPYPAYKPSGVEWLGDVPEHWEVKKLRYQTSINDETLPENTAPDYELLYVDISSVDPSHGIVQKEPMVFENAPSRARRIVKNGDTIVSTVRTYRRAISPVTEPEENLIVSTGFAVIRPNKINPDYLSAAIRAPYFIETVVSRSVGVSYPAINASEIGLISIPLPPLPEQQAIAAFLDRETGRIDALIAKKKNLLTLLAEQRTALISRAVTKGLNLSVKLKPSGVEWLGDVPKHWEVKKGKYLGVLQSTPNVDEEEQTEEGGLINYIKVDDLNTLDNIPFFKKSRLDCTIIKKPFVQNALIFPKRGAAIFTNKVSILLGKALLDPNMMGWKILKKYNLKYVYHTLLLRGLDDLADTSTVPQINNKHIYPEVFPLPPLPEQQAIAAFLDRETAKIDTLSAKVLMAIERLKEYRTALISAAVTGKIDVREAV